ncbi:MAG TPA: VOC family protein [Polyangiales bacterium]|nr:VOC family protein [Polyangiales bacterium]
MQRLTPFLWFDTQAEEAARYYCSIFKNSSIGKILRYGDHGPGPKGSVMTIEFTLDGNRFVAINGGPQYKFTPATSFVVECKDQAEIDHYWDKLTAGGMTQPCGWLVDKYGLSWQVVPVDLVQLIEAPKAMQAMLKMTKFDIRELQDAARA